MNIHDAFQMIKDLGKVSVPAMKELGFEAKEAEKSPVAFGLAAYKVFSMSGLDEELDEAHAKVTKYIYEDSKEDINA